MRGGQGQVFILVGDRVDPLHLRLQVPDPGRLQGHAERLTQGTLDVEFDFLAVRLPHVQQHLLLRGEELPIEKILELAPVDRKQLGAFPEAKLVGNRIRLYCGDPDHAFPFLRAAKDGLRER